MWIDDQVLEHCTRPYQIETWVPESHFVVLGSSNKEEIETNFDSCKRDGVEILKRLGGGGTVLLHPGCVIVSIGCWVKDYYENGKYFSLLNRLVIKALASTNSAYEGLSENGISDIVNGDRKIAGTSLFRSRNYLLYQASILVEPKRDLIEKYLAHPSREPEYRKGKSHSQFISGLAEIYSQAEPHSIDKDLSASLKELLPRHLKGELIQPSEKQIAHVLSRRGSSHPRS